jgi:hypothetical protein
VRVTPDCDTVGSVAICNRADAQFGPALAFNGRDYVVAWSDRRFSGTYWWTTVARVSAEGVVLDTGLPVGHLDAHNEFYPDIAFDGTRCLAVWYHSYYAPWGIYARFVNDSGRPEDTVLTVAAAATHLYNFPKVEFGDSAYLVVWADLREHGTDYDVYGQLVTRSGRLAGPRITVATGTEEQTRPDVMFHDGSYVVVWAEEGVVRGQQVCSDGVLSGSRFAVSDTGAGGRSCPRVAAGPGSRLVAWSEARGPTCDIYATIGPLPGIVGPEGDPQSRQPMPTLGRIRFSPGIEAFDRSGRRVSSRPGPGVYFVRQANCRLSKVVVTE